MGDDMREGCGRGRMRHPRVAERRPSGPGSEPSGGDNHGRSKPVALWWKDMSHATDERRPDVLFVNGVNSAFGGSGANANRNWLASIRRVARCVTVFDSVPTFGVKRMGYPLKAILAVYFMPGTVFRFSRFPGLELLHKLSPICAVRLWMTVRKARPDLMVFSGQNVFLYSLLFPKAKRVFLIQDLLYIRAKSLAFPRVLCKLLFQVERALYRRAAKLTVLSQGERRILARFVDASISLVSCLDVEVAVDTGVTGGGGAVALISDWRRPENRHGVVAFFSGGPAGAACANVPPFVIYGLGIESLREVIVKSGLDGRYRFVYHGAYGALSDVREDVFLVPIYHGAGIKMKVIEALNAGRYVVGTPGAFLGLKRHRLGDVSRVVCNPEDIAAFEADRRMVQDRFRGYYFGCFQQLGDTLFEASRAGGPSPDDGSSEMAVVERCSRGDARRTSPDPVSSRPKTISRGIL